MQMSSAYHRHWVIKKNWWNLEVAVATNCFFYSTEYVAIANIIIQQL